MPAQGCQPALPHARTASAPTRDIINGTSRNCFSSYFKSVFTCMGILLLEEKICATGQSGSRRPVCPVLCLGEVSRTTA